jgi:hypothetical protein
MGLLGPGIEVKMEVRPMTNVNDIVSVMYKAEFDARSAGERESRTTQLTSKPRESSAQ